MQIKSISISNFRGIDRVDLQDLSDRLFLTGANAQGKTSVVNAIQYVLFGRCLDQVGKRIENNQLIKRGEKQAEIKIGLEINTSTVLLDCTITHKSSSLTGYVNDKPTLTGSPADVRKSFWKRCKMDMLHAECAMNPRAYMLSDDLGKLIQDLSSGGIDDKQIFELAGEHADWLAGYVTDNGLSMASPKALQEIGATAFNTRTAVNKAIKGYEADIKHYETLPAPSPVERDESLIASLRDSVAACEAIVNKQAANLKQIDDAIKDDMGEVNTLSRNKDVLQSRADALEKQIQETAKADRCPTCGKSITKPERDKAIKPLGEELQRVNVNILTINSELSEVNAGLASLRDNRSKVDREYHAAQSDLSRNQSALAKAEQATAVADYSDTIAAFNRKLDACLEDKVHLDWCVEAFRDGALTNQVTGDARTEFANKVNAELERLGVEPRCEIVDTDGSIELYSNGIPARLASDGELIVLQMAVARAFAGTDGIISVDGVDRIDNINGRKGRLLLNHSNPSIFAGAFGQSSANPGALAKAFAPALVIWVDGGKAEVLR